MTNTVTKTGEQLSISQILRNVITLSDYSSFAVRFLDSWKLWRWSPEQKVVVTENSNKKYPSIISNTDVSFARSAAAKIITRARPAEIPHDVA